MAYYKKKAAPQRAKDADARTGTDKKCAFFFV